MDRNFKHKENENETKMDILKTLYPEETSLDNLKQKIPKNIKPSTLFKYLSKMEKDGLLLRVFQVDKRKRNYKITKKGQSLIKKLDVETKGRIFTLNVFADIEDIFQLWRIFDSRIHDDIFFELLRKHDEILDYKARPNYNEEKLSRMITEFTVYLITYMKKNNLTAASQSTIILREEFFELIKNNISESLLYISLKAINTQNPALLDLLTTFPKLLASRIVLYGLPIDQFKKHIKLFKEYDGYYQESQDITPEAYKEAIDMFSKNSDLNICKAIGDDFTDAFIENSYKRTKKRMIEDAKIKTDKENVIKVLDMIENAAKTKKSIH